MRKTLYIAILMLIVFNQLYSQEFKIGYQQGIGKYSMSGLKDINKGIQPDLPFETEIVSDFPVYWYYRPSVSLKFKELEIGLVYSFQSTGSRISAKDYSGEYRFDMKVKSHNPGIFIGFDFIERNKMSYAVYSALGVTFSNLNMNEYLYVQETIVLNDDIKFKGLNYYLESGISLCYPVKFIDFAIYLWYCFPFGDQAFYTQNNKDYVLIDPVSSESVKPDWGGFRIGLSAYFTFKKND